jgi:hypothetical protein
MKSFCNTGMKILFGIVLLISGFTVTAQNNIIVKYYDTIWRNVPRDSAVYYTEFEKTNNFYNCTSYFLKSKRIKSTSTFTDTVFTKQIGLLKRYYETGILEDSILAKENSDDLEFYHNYPNGKLWAYSYYNSKTSKSKAKGYNEKGQEIEDFVLSREASYPDGDKAWINYLSENINVNVPGKNKASTGSYNVIVAFEIDKSGKIINVTPETNIGFGMEKELMRVIKKSVRWIPAIEYNQPLNAYRRQPLTFLVQ